ncbi:helix-turn-helix domain-containing protein [Actinophytocola sp.]|uniref:helix-turn-helix domain-containing protein n=1 Tax=Actinophytocola sp. TaxID=1872138 RepID=UPI0025BD022D|nr:helix-turn-helix domain-containing protein [Actinophytocola sp.]
MAQLRGDAERNRDRVLVAARRLYAAEGFAVAMAAVAREAGVGVATLFRRFPTREDLVAAVFADTMDAYATTTTAALADPWHGFTGSSRSCATPLPTPGAAWSPT